MEEKKEELMNAEDFEKYLHNSINLRSFACVSKFKSVIRAAKRGNITRFGDIIPKRPFNNRKETKGRQHNTLKKQIYGELIRRSREVKEEAGV